jgi:hypothetical protein
MDRPHVDAIAGALMNAVFARPGTILIEFQPKKTLYHTVALDLRLRYWAIMCTGKLKQQWGDDDYTLPIPNWEKVLEVALGNWTGAR